MVKDKNARLESLHRYYPEANGDEWELIEAGQRVQIMKKDAKKGGILQFGTEVVSSADGSIAALLGASPGASTAAPIMLNLLRGAFPLSLRVGSRASVLWFRGMGLNSTIIRISLTKLWLTLHIP